MDCRPAKQRSSYGTGLVLAACLYAQCGGAAAPAAVTEASPSTRPAAPAPDSATDAYTEFRRAFDAAQYASAVPPAQRVLQLAEQQSQVPTAEDVQVALMNLAFTQYLAGDYVAAEASFLRAIRLVQDSGRPLHQRLARAYAGLASTYHDAGRHDLAVGSFDQAIALTRRHEGLLNEQQVPLLRKYVDSLTELGRYSDALQAQRYLLRIATRKYGEGSIELVPALEQLGQWYTRVGAYDQARRTLKHGIAIVEQAEGAKSPKLIGLLVAIASCDRTQLLDPAQQAMAAPDAQGATIFHEPGVPEPAAFSYSPVVLLAEGEKALTRAAAIAEERPDASPVEVADVRTQLGDWYQGRGQPEQALPHYQRAWQAAAGVTAQVAGQPLVEALFGKPVMLQISRPEAWDRYAERPRKDIEVRTVSVDLTVDPQGRPQAGRVVDDSGDAKRAEKTLDAARTARYRPRFEQGQPVATAGVVYTQPWIVLVGQKDDASKPAAEASAARSAKSMQNGG